MNRRGLGLGLTLALGCGEPTEHRPESRQLGQPLPNEPEPARTEPARIEPPRLSVAAVRHGSMRLIEDGPGVLVVDTDAWTLTDAGPIPPTTRVDASRVKTLPLATLEVEDHVESPSGDAFLLTFLEHRRSGWMDGRLYRRVDGRWMPHDTLGKAGVASFQHSLLVRDGAVLGLWDHRARMSESREHEISNAAVDELALSHGFTKLAGPEVELPRLPAAIELEEALAGTDGTIYALTKAREQEVQQLVIWPPGRVEAEYVTLPDAGDLERAALSISGDEVFVSGDGMYLARGRGHAWTRVPVELIDEHGKLEREFISDVLGTPEGGLWLSVATGHDGRVFHRPPKQTAWIHVPLPNPWAPISPDIPDRWWAFDREQGWVELAVADADETVMWIRELGWASGRVWIELEGMPILDDGGMLVEPRSLLVTVGELGRPAVQMPSADERRFEALHGKGEKVCGAPYRDFVWVVLGAGERPITLDADQLDALRELDREDDDLWLGLFVGELEGRRALIVQAGWFEEVGDVGAWVERLSERLDVPAKIDCRPWRAVEAGPIWRAPNSP